MTAVAPTAALSLRVRLGRAEAKTDGVWLEEGDAVHYRGLGAGRVIRQEQRALQGRDCTFAVIEFPHREMTAHIPLRDPAYATKLRPVASASSLKNLLKLLSQDGEQLARTWDERESLGQRRLHEGLPSDWAELLRDYASARRGGFAITASDADLVRETLELLAAEYACATSCDFLEGRRLIQEAYEKASVISSR